MSRTRLGRAAIVSLMLGTATVACNPGGAGHVASIGETPARADADAARLAGKARAALARHDAGNAIRYAERAVAAAPRDARHRALLGQAYLAAGRFASAEASLRDSLTIAPGQPRASLDLALAEIAQRRAGEARGVLATLDGKVPDADLGLAVALSGDRARAIELLSGLVRSGKSDARARQNLALAFALDGQWPQARGMAMQDTPPDRINDQIAGWAELAGANDARAQVASMLGAVPAAADPGRPAMLALAAPPAPMAAPAPTLAPVALAAAAARPAPSALAVAPTTIAPAPVVSRVAVPVMVAAAAMPMPAPAASPAIVPVLLAAPKPMPAPLLRVAIAPVSPGPLLRPAGRGGFVVQLGAFSRAGALQAAWSRASRLSPRVATFTPVSGRTSVSGANLVRLSIGGFGNREQAIGLCRQIRARGGVCFVRSIGNDTPWQWAGREGGSQLAMADARDA